MANKFTGAEIVEIAIQIEKNGRDFYNAVAMQSRHKNAKNIFKHLAEEEKKHIETFQGVLNSVKKYEPKEAYPQEYFSYINSLAGEEVFTDRDNGEEMARNVESDKTAVDIGIDSEKYSIKFYDAMKKLVPEEDIKILDEVIAEENKHLKELAKLKESLWQSR